EFTAAAEDVEKLRRLPLRAIEHPQLVENDSPRDDRDHPEQEQHDQRNWCGASKNADDRRAGTFGRNSALRLQEQGDERASKRAQTALRDVAGAPLGQRRRDSPGLRRRTVSCCEIAVKPMLRLEFSLSRCSAFSK